MLEKIKEMNIPVGAPIELKLKEFETRIRYFQSLAQGKIAPSIQIDKYILVSKNKYGNKLVDEGEYYRISDLEDIKILEYKK